MKSSRVIIRVLLAVGLLAGLALGGCAPAKTEKLKVVTSTSLLAYIVEQVAGDKVEILNLVPPAQHPGDFNVKPSDIQKLAESDIFLLHGWPGETYADKMIESANNPNLLVAKVEVNGSWMIPPAQAEATDKVASILSQADSKNEAAYHKSAEAYKKRIAAKEAEIKAKLAQADVAQINVICAAFQADSLKWMGLNVVATYGLPNSLTPQVVQELVDKGRAAKVTLIADNLHSGKDAGAGIAEELGAKRIILLNFPGGFDNTETWEKAIDYNVAQILGAIAK